MYTLTKTIYSPTEGQVIMAFDIRDGKVLLDAVGTFFDGAIHVVLKHPEMPLIQSFHIPLEEYTHWCGVQYLREMTTELIASGRVCLQ
jgi:hypothetical protein